jgi:hypothetical protein
LKKISTFSQTREHFFLSPNQLFDFLGFLFKSPKENLKSTDLSGIRTQSTIIFKLFAYHLAIRCFFPLENLITNAKVTDIKLKRSVIEKIQENRSDRKNSTHHSNTKKRHFGTIMLNNHNKVPLLATK